MGGGIKNFFQKRVDIFFDLCYYTFGIFVYSEKLFLFKSLNII